MKEHVVRVMCPSLRCRRILAVPEHARGKTVRCKGCGMNVRIPPKGSQPKPEGKPEPATNPDGEPLEA